MTEVRSTERNKFDLHLEHPVFPFAEERIKRFMEKINSPVLVITGPEWFEALRDLAGKYNLRVFQWQGNITDEMAGACNSCKCVVTATPIGENEMARQIRDELRIRNIDIMVLKLLRDVFTQLTIHAGGDPRPQESWPPCPAGSHPYFIFAIPRCGSTFFSDILGNTKILGFPREHLLFDLLPVFFHTDLTFKEWVRSLSSYSYTSNGYSGTKIISHLFLEIIKHYQEQGHQEMLEELFAFFKQYPVIYLKRMNRVRQAVSLIIARKTAVWHVKNNKKVVSEKSDAILTEDPKEIELAVKWFSDQEQKLENFYTEAGITPKVYFYEDFANPSRQEQIFREVFSFLGVKYDERIPEPSYSALADELNDALVKSYYGYLEERLKTDISPQNSAEALILSSVVAEINQVNETHPSQEQEQESKAKSRKWWKFGTEWCKDVQSIFRK